MASRIHTIVRTLAFVSLIALAAQGSAQRGGGARGGGQARASAGTHHKSTHHATGTHRSTTGGAHANRNVNANNNVNVNRNVNVNVQGHGYGYGAHPVARGAIAGATAAAVMGSYYRTLPAGCATVNNGGVIYHHCGSTWYRTEGSQYLVVPAP